MVLLWDSCGNYYGIAVGLRWDRSWIAVDCSGIAVVLLWDCCGIAVVVLWDCCETAVALLPDCCVIILVLLWRCGGMSVGVL